MVALIPRVERERESERELPLGGLALGCLKLKHRGQN